MTISECENRGFYAVHRAIYGEPDRTIRDWGEATDLFEEGDVCYLAYEGGMLAGGFALNGPKIHLPFLASPFSDGIAFWKSALAWTRERFPGEEIEIHHVSCADADMLARLGARLKWAQRRMCRPTAPLKISRLGGFSYEPPRKAEHAEIVRAVYEAHASGYTATVYGPPDRSEIDRAIARRFEAFQKTDTLGVGVVARDRATGALAGVCMAGIYPDSPNNFSTIHQISVVPAYRNRGLGESMIRYSIAAAHPVSPVITLQVLAGNPAERLYRKMGFVAGPSLADLMISGPTA